jgi:hypothetical protein
MKIIHQEGSSTKNRETSLFCEDGSFEQNTWGDDKGQGTPLNWVPRFMGHVSLSLSADVTRIDSNLWIGCQHSAPVLLLKVQKHVTLCTAISRSCEMLRLTY